MESIPTAQEIDDLKHHFEYEKCGVCNGDWYDHDISEILGHPFYLCKIATNENHKVNAQEAIAS